jgi:hypothetical protein
MTRSALFLLIALALVAGCGGDDRSSTEDFVADANKICREGAQRLEEVTREQQESLGELDSLEKQQEAVASALESSAKAYEPYMDRLRELEPPSDLAAPWSEFLDGVARAFDLIGDLAEATRANDRDRLRELSAEFTRIARETRPFAEEHRLDECLPDDDAG